MACNTLDCPVFGILLNITTTMYISNELLLQICTSFTNEQIEIAMMSKLFAMTALFKRSQTYPIFDVLRLIPCILKLPMYIVVGDNFLIFCFV